MAGDATPRLGSHGETVIGAVVGLAWGLSLRSWMTHLAILFQDWPRYTWEGTFLSVLVPSTVIGALIGWDFGLRRRGGKRHAWVVWSPLLLVVGPAILADNFIGTLMDTGEGGGAIGVVLVGLSGGYALSRRGRRWARILSGVVALVIVGAMTMIFYLSSSPLTSSEAFGALNLVVLMVGLCLGCSVPMRRDSGALATYAEREALTR